MSPCQPQTQHQELEWHNENNAEYRPRKRGFESQLCHFLHVWPRASYLISLDLSSLSLKNEVVQFRLSLKFPPTLNLWSYAQSLTPHLFLLSYLFPLLVPPSSQLPRFEISVLSVVFPYFSPTTSNQWASPIDSASRISLLSASFIFTYTSTLL